jgi:hypothetical protein
MPPAPPPGTDPDRASFTIAWQAARDQLIQAAGVIAATVVDLAGTIGRHVLAAPLPARRLRVSPRIVKRAIPKYQARGPDIDRASYKATVSIDILAPPGALTVTTNAQLHGLETSPALGAVTVPASRAVALSATPHQQAKRRGCPPAMVPSHIGRSFL